LQTQRTGKRIAKCFFALFVATALAIFPAATAFGADWPMWRCTADRAGAAPGRLPGQLRELWVRELPAPAKAWPNEPRLHFDASYEPVVMGKTLFFGSPNDGSVAALDTETGRLKWRFYTEGPVRFAPVAWKGRLYVASDDGRLYCLDASTAAVKWVFRAVPAGTPDMRHLGNARLVSFWPVRGGPVLADGRLYLASGIWPSMGVFVYALDAETGKVLWKNEKLHFLPNTRVDHNLLGDAGCSPQGYLVVTGDKLLVPNGRAMPAGLQLKTGQLLYYLQGYRNGDCRVTAKGRYAFVGKNGVIDVNTGREVGSRYAQAGKDAPKGLTSRYDLFEGPYFRYKFMDGCDAWSVLPTGAAFGLSKGTVYAYDLRRAAVSTYTVKHRGRDLKPARWDAPLLWKLPAEGPGKGAPSGALIKVGPRLYGHSGKTLFAVDVPRRGGGAKIVWRKKLGDAPGTILAADGKLFVVTATGWIHCFAGSRRGETKKYARELATLPMAKDGWAQRVARILRTTGVSEGYCVVLGLKTGRLVQELLGASRLKIIAVDSDRATVRRLRDTLLGAGLYGERAQVFCAEPLKFALPPFIADLVVSETLSAADVTARVTAGGLFRVLRPYGGVACLAASGDGAAFERWTKESGLRNARLSRDAGFVLLRRVGALPGAAPWTHEAADAARSYYSRDKRLRAPLGVLWYGDGPDHGFSTYHDYDSGVKPQVVGGRLFAVNLPRKKLGAVDVYTGRLLWKVDVGRPCRFASMEDGVYVASRGACKVLDPATGKPLRKFELRLASNEPRRCSVADIRLGDDVIVVNVTDDEAAKHAAILLEGTTLIALDRRSGGQLWTKRANERFNNHALALGGGNVFCVDSMSIRKSNELKRRGKPPANIDSTIIALDPRTGREKWRFVARYPYRKLGYIAPLTLRANDDWLAYSEVCGVLLAGKARTVLALDPRDGKLLWRTNVDGPQPMILWGEKFVHQHGKAYYIRTGKEAGEMSFFRTNVGGLRGCNYGVGGYKFVFVREISAAYVDLESGEKYHLRNIRTGCSASLIAADGVLAVPNFATGCVCNYPLQTAFAMIPMPAVARWARPTLVGGDH